MDVPTLTPMMMGTDARTVSTAGGGAESACGPPCPRHHPGRECARTLSSHHADHDGGGRAGTLHQGCDQHANDQSSHRVGQHHVVLEDVSGQFAYTGKRGALKLRRAGCPPRPGHPSRHSLPSSWKAELRTSREQMKKYRLPRSPQALRTLPATRRSLPATRRSEDTGQAVPGWPSTLTGLPPRPLILCSLSPLSPTGLGPISSSSVTPRAGPGSLPFQARSPWDPPSQEQEGRDGWAEVASLPQDSTDARWRDTCLPRGGLHGGVPHSQPVWAGPTLLCLPSPLGDRGLPACHPRNLQTHLSRAGLCPSAEGGSRGLCPLPPRLEQNWRSLWR